jgi:hypothetical protein
MSPGAFTETNSKADGCENPQSHAIAIAVANAVEKSITDRESVAYSDFNGFSLSEPDAIAFPDCHGFSITDSDTVGIPFCHCFVPFHGFIDGAAVGSVSANVIVSKHPTFTEVYINRRHFLWPDFIIDRSNH